MTDTPQPLHVVMFSGGRGTASITDAFLKHGQISLTILVNAYDDGLSTGALRGLIPGMLGPSDIRKNVSRLMPDTDRADRALRHFIEYRFPMKTSKETALAVLRDFCSPRPALTYPDLAGPYLHLNRRQTDEMARYLNVFLDFFDHRPATAPAFDFSDCSFGNILFSGCYLEAGKSFNHAVERFSVFAGIRGRVLNITDGENLILMALKQNGSLLLTEAEIVAAQDNTPIDELFLLSDYLSKEQQASLKSLDTKTIANRLRALERIPRINPLAEDALRQADIIIYGPGTQHSSLFPSYWTERLADTIAANHQAEKIFVGNIAKDFEIRNETANTLVDKFLFYLNGKGRHSYAWNDLVSLFFMQASGTVNRKAADYVFCDPATFPFPKERVILTNWESDAGAHSGGRVTDELISVVNSKWSKKMKPFHHMVSIVVPALNEERTVRTVLQDLSRLNFESLGLAREIILVDGASTDHTVERARSVPDVTVLQLEQQKGRGAALRLGIEKANGNLIVFFPSDNEYKVTDLLPIVQTLMSSDFRVVFGSRSIKCVNMNERIRAIYKGNFLLYLTSKYGGMLVSILNLLIYNRFISDPFTSIKAFDARILKGLALSANGMDIETEILARLGKQGIFILEVPVDYRPRTRQEGKKTTVWDGLRSVWRMILIRWLPR